MGLINLVDSTHIEREMYTYFNKLIDIKMASSTEIMQIGVGILCEQLVEVYKEELKQRQKKIQRKCQC